MAPASPGMHLALVLVVPAGIGVSVDMVDCARVKDVLEVSVRSRWQGRG